MIPKSFNRHVGKVQAQIAASHRLLERMAGRLQRQLAKTEHPAVKPADVQRLLDAALSTETTSATLCRQMREHPLKEEPAIIAVLGSPEGEATARQHFESWKLIEKLVIGWQDGSVVGREQCESAAPNAEAFRARALSLEFAAFAAQCEAHGELTEALTSLHTLQYWVWDGVFDYAGAPEKTEEAPDGK